MHAGGQRFDPARLHQLYIKSALADFLIYLKEAKYDGGVAQLARAIGSYPVGRGFESLPRYQFNNGARKSRNNKDP